MTRSIQDPKHGFRLSEARIRMAPSILSADFTRLAEEVSKIEAAGGTVEDHGLNPCHFPTATAEQQDGSHGHGRKGQGDGDVDPGWTKLERTRQEQGHR